MALRKQLVAVLLVFPQIACAATPSVAELAWLGGCWASDGGEPGSVENWMAPAGGTMLGMNRSVRGGKTRAYEFIRISEEDNGQIVFVASPSGQKPATFTLIKLTDREVVFENPEHDFPQRISYRLDRGSKLIGRIEGTVNGETSVVDFPMTRIRCD